MGAQKELFPMCGHRVNAAESRKHL
jgi:hypothetical protein